MADADNGERLPETGSRKRLSVGRLLPAIVLVAGLALFFVFDLGRFLSLEALKVHREALQAWVVDYGFLAAVVYAAIYALAVSFSVPGATIITIAGGFLFGPWLATIYVVTAATVGATAVFLAARFALGDFLRERAGSAIERMEAGFRENEVSYMLILRLVPLFPFWLVNLVPAFLGVRTSVYVLCTLVGIIPGSFVYTLVGDGAGAVLDEGGDLDLGIIFEPRFLAPIVGLVLLACIPVIYKRFAKRRQAP